MLKVMAMSTYYNIKSSHYTIYQANTLTQQSVEKLPKIVNRAETD